MKKIKYYASNDSMGYTTEENCDNFRTWAKEALEKRFPNFEIDISSKASLETCVVYGESYEETEEITEFCHYLWENAPDEIWTLEND